MRRLLRVTSSIATLIGAVSCAASNHGTAAAQDEYRWAFHHGGCDCRHIAYAPRNIDPSFSGRETVAAYVHDEPAKCAWRRFIVVASGAGTGNPDVDLDLARARAKPFARRLSDVSSGRVDTLAFAGANFPHPSTLQIICPTDRLHAQDSF